MKPFGFLLSLTAKLDFGGERFSKPKRGRPKRALSLKPIAPFDSDYATAITLAFDRESGMPIKASALKTYSDALASYHIQPESKFLNADYVDSGVTLRRHVEMIGVHHIGKESHDWERQATIGLNAESDIEYGLSGDDRGELGRMLEGFIAEFGEATTAKALGVRLTKLRALLGSREGANSTTVQALVARVPRAMQLCKKLRADRRQELQRLRELVDLNGLRQAARQLGVDPSNLRRSLSRSKAGLADSVGAKTVHD